MTAPRTTPEHQELPGPCSCCPLSQLDPHHCSQTFQVPLTELTLQGKGPFPPLLTGTLMQIKASVSPTINVCSHGQPGWNNPAEKCHLALISSLQRDL